MHRQAWLVTRQARHGGHGGALPLSPSVECRHTVWLPGGAPPSATQRASTFACDLLTMMAALRPCPAPRPPPRQSVLVQCRAGNVHSAPLYVCIVVIAGRAESTAEHSPISVGVHNISLYSSPPFQGKHGSEVCLMAGHQLQVPYPAVLVMPHSERVDVAAFVQIPSQDPARQSPWPSSTGHDGPHPSCSAGAAAPPRASRRVTTLQH